MTICSSIGDSDGTMRQDANAMYHAQQKAYQHTFKTMVAVLDTNTGEPILAHRKHGQRTLVDPRVMINWHNCQPAFAPVLFMRFSPNCFFAMVDAGYIQPRTPVIWESQQPTGSEWAFGLTVVNREDWVRERGLSVEEMMQEDRPSSTSHRQKRGLKAGDPRNPGFACIFMGLSKPVFKKDDWMQKDAKSRKADFDLWVQMQGEQERVNNSGCASWKQNTDSGLAAKYKPGAPAIVIVSNKFPRFIQSDGAGVLGSGGFMS